MPRFLPAREDNGFGLRSISLMKPGMGSLLFGIALLLLGVVVTFSSGHVIWYGAILVGIYRIIRGLITLSQGSEGPQG